MVEERRRATIVFAHDWGADGAQANVEHQIKTIGRSLNAELEVTTVPGIPPLGSPLIAAIEFDRVIDTHRITLELCARKLEAKGLSKDEIEKIGGKLLIIVKKDISGLKTGQVREKILGMFQKLSD